MFFFFSPDKITVQWYFIVGTVLAVTVLASIVLYLWKRRFAGTYIQAPVNGFAVLTEVVENHQNVHKSNLNNQNNFILPTSSHFLLVLDSTAYFAYFLGRYHHNKI